MKERKIRLAVDDAGEFVKTASRCDFDIDIFYNRVIIDAKSILGVLGLDFSQVLTVKYGGDDREFETMIKRHVVG